jgi:hypothetical protein
MEPTEREETFVDRMVYERRDLATKAKKLEEFINSEVFDSLSKQKRILLSQQLALMIAYDGILLKRIELEK